jgi:hypothetical protein
MAPRGSHVLAQHGSALSVVSAPAPLPLTPWLRWLGLSLCLQTVVAGSGRDVGGGELDSSVENERVAVAAAVAEYVAGQYVTEAVRRHE